MNEKPFFSIIVPIYKVEHYLEQCINSILAQTLYQFELVLVDDGSPDNCGKMCDVFAVKDNRIRVVHKKNGGLSSARNAGIDVCVGSYVIFIDSDDFWDDENALKKIYSNLLESNAELLVFPAKRYYEKNDTYTYILNTKVDRKCVLDNNPNNAIRYMLENNIYRAAAWNKVVKKSVIDEYKMRFKEGYLSEDMDWCGDLLLYCKKFDFYESPFYCYRQQRKGSITVGKNEKLVSDKLYMIKKGYQQALSLNDKEKKELLASYYAYEYAVMLGVSSGIKNKRLNMEIKRLKGLLNYDISNKVKKVNRLKKILGYSLTRRALCFFVRIKK